MYIKLADYKDSTNRVTACKYYMAASCLSSGDYESAMKLFTELGTYEDSAYQLSVAWRGMLKSAVVGSVVEFGCYEQNGNESDGSEPIQWVVLENTGEQLFLCAKYILDVRKTVDYEEYAVPWNSRDSREWLNGSFFDVAFSDEEKDMVVTTKIENPDVIGDIPGMVTPGGGSTQDNVFLLLEEEYSKYADELVSGIQMTAYAAVSEEDVISEINSTDPNYIPQLEIRKVTTRSTNEALGAWGEAAVTYYQPAIWIFVG